jgi:hypothetical protein
MDRVEGKYFRFLMGKTEKKTKLDKLGLNGLDR